MSLQVLILGSEGFIGSNLSRYFKAAGHTVYDADIVLKQSEGYFLINPELPEFSFLFSSQSFDVCINATGAANVQLSFQHPSLDFTLNTFNVYNILDAIRKHNPSCKFINLGSAAVYGNPANLPIRETDPLQPLSPYGFHKLYSEQICAQFHQLYKMPIVTLRIFSAYGQGLRKQLFWDVSRKIEAAKEKQQQYITLFGTGNESRDFIYVDDICRVIALIIEKAAFDGKPINVASGRETTIAEAVTTFAGLLNDQLEVRFGGETKVGDPNNWRADVSVIADMGFTNYTDIGTGLKRLAQWIKDQK